MSKKKVEVLIRTLKLGELVGRGAGAGAGAGTGVGVEPGQVPGMDSVGFALAALLGEPKASKQSQTAPNTSKTMSNTTSKTGAASASALMPMSQRSALKGSASAAALGTNMSKAGPCSRPTSPSRSAHFQDR